MTTDAGNADEFLVDRIRQGDSMAWRQLIDRYHGRLIAFAKARTACLSDAEDLVQEAFVGFLQSLNYYNSARSLETYLFTILRYKLYDQLRQRKLSLAPGGEDNEDWWDRAMPTSMDTPSAAAAQAEALQQQEQLLGELLQRLIHELRDRQAFEDLQVIELIFFAGRRNLDVAELLDMDQKAVAGVKFRALQRMQKFLGERDPESLACLAEDSADLTVARVWRERRFTCLKRSTLGSYVLGILEEPWNSYTQFHLDVVSCAMCLANLTDLQEEQEAEGPRDHERIFQSSVGFIKRSDVERREGR